MLDVDIEFFKVKKLLEKNPAMLKDDPILSVDYMKIINLLKQKKMMENTSDHFDPENTNKTVWNDLRDL